MAFPSEKTGRPQPFKNLQREAVHILSLPDGDVVFDSLTKALQYLEGRSDIKSIVFSNALPYNIASQSPMYMGMLAFHGKEPSKIGHNVVDNYYYIGQTNEGGQVFLSVIFRDETSEDESDKSTINGPREVMDYIALFKGKEWAYKYALRIFIARWNRRHVGDERLMIRMGNVVFYLRTDRESEMLNLYRRFLVAEEPLASVLRQEIIEKVEQEGHYAF